MKKLIPFFLIFFLYSCKGIDDKVSIPDTILSEQKMAEVMVDVHLLEAALNIGTYTRDQMVMNNISPNSDILKKNNITKKQYDESFEFYSKNTVLFTEVFQLVLNNLSKMQAEVMTKE